MKCEQILSVIDEYRSRELDESRASAVSAHLRACASCRHELELLDAEEKTYQAYAASVERALGVPPDLWQRAWRRHQEEKNRASGAPAVWLKHLAPISPLARQALAAVLLVAVSVAGTLWIVGRHRASEAPVTQQSDRETVSAGGGLEAALASVQRAEEEYQKAIRQLNAVVEKRKSTLDPRIMAELQDNLRMIDDHIAATRKAYYAHPQDPELALYMLAAYGRKVELLQELTS